MVTLRHVTVSLCGVVVLGLVAADSAGAVERVQAVSLIQRCPPSPNCVSSRDPSDGGYIRPFSFDGPVAEAWEELKSALAEEPRLAIVEEKFYYLRAEASSLVFGFVDDLEFQLMPEEHIIDVRSASRVGYWDVGVNRRRVERIREHFNARMSTRGSTPTRL